MHICIDITALYVAQGGVFWQHFNLIKALLEIDRENTYTLLDYYPIHGGWTNPSAVEELTAPHSITIHSRGFRHYRLSRWWPFQRPGLRYIADRIDTVLDWPLSTIADVVMRSRLTRVLQGIDVFHASDVLFWAQPGALNVSTIHDLTTVLFPELHTAGNRELHLQKLRFVQEHTDIIIAVSECTKRDIVKHLGIAPERVRVVYNGVSSDFHPIEDQAYMRRVLAVYGLSPKSYILHVGTIEPRKNLMRLVQAYKCLLDTLPTLTLKLVFVGGAGWHFEELFKLVETLQLKEQVVFVGSVPAEALPVLYNGASLFVYPSLYEGFGLPPLEAMACGVPVITSNNSSLPEVVGDAGVMVPPTDVAALAEAMAVLLRDPERCQTLREAGLTRAAQFSWKRTARELLEIYNRAGQVL